ncbi:hypothetical protein D3C71_1849780 [compost metagenome]
MNQRRVGAQISDAAVGRGVLGQRREIVAFERLLPGRRRIGHQHFDAQRLGAGPNHFNGLRMGAGRDHETPAR